MDSVQVGLNLKFLRRKHEPMGLEDRLMPFEYYQLHLNNNLPCLERIAGPLQAYRRFFFFLKGIQKLF